MEVPYITLCQLIQALSKYLLADIRTFLVSQEFAMFAFLLGCFVKHQISLLRHSSWHRPIIMSIYIFFARYQMSQSIAPYLINVIDVSLNSFIVLECVEVLDAE